MTDRLKGCIVVFDADYRDDDAESILEAIGMVKGVQSVTPEVSNSQDWMARERIKFELRDKLFEVLR